MPRFPCCGPLLPHRATRRCTPGVLVYFGHPQAHEDDAERAVRAGLELVEAAGRLKSRTPLQTRVDRHWIGRSRRSDRIGICCAVNRANVSVLKVTAQSAFAAEKPGVGSRSGSACGRS
jgi:hypothetical protein